MIRACIMFILLILAFYAGKTFSINFPANIQKKILIFIGSMALEADTSLLNQKKLHAFAQ